MNIYDKVIDEVQTMSEDYARACRERDAAMAAVVTLTAERDAASAEAQEWLTEAAAWKKQATENHAAAELARDQVKELAEWKAWAERELGRMTDGEKALTDRCAELYNHLHGLPPVTEPTIAAGTGPVAMPTPDPDPGDFAGWQGVVKRHSQEIGEIQDECSKLREAVKSLRQYVDELVGEQ